MLTFLVLFKEIVGEELNVFMLESGLYRNPLCFAEKSVFTVALLLLYKFLISWLE